MRRSLGLLVVVSLVTGLTACGTLNPGSNSASHMQVAAGAWHSLALLSDGSVWGWGYNADGQVGDGSTTGRDTPVQVHGLPAVVSLAAGGDFESGHSLALAQDGTVWAWGYNAYGQLGINSTADSYTPVQVPGLSGVVSIAAGLDHSLALTRGGSVYAWGLNANGQLGDGTTTERDVPVAVSGLSGVVAVSAGGNHYTSPDYGFSLALTAGGSVYAWGSNAYGQLGDGTTTDRHAPVKVPGLSNVVAVSAAGAHAMALEGDGSVWVWGRNDYGQLGDGTITDQHAPEKLTSLSGVTMIAAGAYDGFAVTPDGHVWGWGYGGSGDLGTGTSTDSHVPVQVLTIDHPKALSSGGNYDADQTLAMDAAGNVYAWGLNDYGQVGSGSGSNEPSPVKVLSAP
ncbi:MAG TPA: hypothetical protein VKB31_05555 [Trueperaceae bacterium]|nr:hypothetical protein [Trueperaceae bacterium]